MTHGPDGAGPGEPAAALFKRPESVLVVVYTRALECLLLKRIAPPDFWQSVTGSLGWNETPAEAAARELGEETGLAPAGLVDAAEQVSFPILPEWQHRFAPGTHENLEHWFYLELPARRSVTLNPDEHDDHAWLDVDAAAARATSWTNRAALERLRRDRPGGGPERRGSPEDGI